MLAEKLVSHTDGNYTFFGGTNWHYHSWKILHYMPTSHFQNVICLTKVKVLILKNGPFQSVELIDYMLLALML